MRLHRAPRRETSWRFREGGMIFIALGITTYIVLVGVVIVRMVLRS